MRIRNIVSLLVLIYAAKSIAADCYIKAWDKNYFLTKESVTATAVIKETNCSEQIQIKFVKSLLDFEGSIQSHYLRDDLPQVDISPKRIVIDSLSNLVNQHLNLGPNYKWDDLKASTATVIVLEQYDSISVKINNTSLGKKSIGLSIINPMKNSNKTIWATGTLTAKVSAFVAKTHIATTFGEINPNKFEKRMIFTAYPERIFSDLSRVAHYRLNSPLNEGQVLKRANTTSLALVRVGVPASISLKANGIQLSGKAIPMRMGKYGDIIQLRSLKGQKTLTGKVVDFNKVVIQL